MDRGTTRKAASSESTVHSNAHGADILPIVANDQYGLESDKSLEGSLSSVSPTKVC